MLSQTQHTQGQHISQGAQPQPSPSSTSIIAPKPNRAVGAKEHISTWSLDSNVWAPDIGWRCTALGVAVTTQANARKLHSLEKSGGATTRLSSDHGGALFSSKPKTTRSILWSISLAFRKVLDHQNHSSKLRVMLKIRKGGCADLSTLQGVAVHLA